ncbi:MAG: exosortase, partial [Rubritepida sp.]|nr:exosortase [Rubritepida sp.]
LTAAALDASIPAARREPARLAAPIGCEAVGPALRCGGATVSASLIVFPAAANWSSVAAVRRQAAGNDDEALTFEVAGPGMRWQVRQGQGQARPGVVGVGAWLDGAAVGDGIRTRANQAWNAIHGDGGSPVLVVVELVPSGELTDGTQDRRIMQAVLAAQRDGLAREAGDRSRR